MVERERNARGSTLKWARERVERAREGFVEATVYDIAILVDALIDTLVLSETGAERRNQVERGMSSGDLARAQGFDLLDRRDGLEPLDLKVGRFGHQPDPAVDFCTEVDVIEGLEYNATIGMIVPDLRERIDRAMRFNVGGDELAVKAKNKLREIDVRVRAAELREAAKLKPDHFPLQPIERDPEGVARFRKNAIVRFLLDTSSHDLNALSRMDFGREHWEQFAQLIGYSVSGFEDLSYVSEEAREEARRIADALPLSSPTVVGAPGRYLIRDREDGTYHVGHGTWANDRERAVVYGTEGAANDALDNDLDPDEILRDRLEIVRQWGDRLEIVRARGEEKKG